MIIDTTDPNKDIIRFVYEKPLLSIVDKKYVIFRVDAKI